MSNITTAVRQYLLTQASVTDLVVARIYPGSMPEKGTLPAIELHKITSTAEQHLRGRQGGRDSRVQINCLSSKSEEAETLREAVSYAMVNHGSNKGAHTLMGDVMVTGVVDEGAFDRYDEPILGQDAARYVQINDFSITHAEAT